MESRHEDLEEFPHDGIGGADARAVSQYVAHSPPSVGLRHGAKTNRPLLLCEEALRCEARVGHEGWKSAT